jgi:hypothetical protein
VRNVSDTCGRREANWRSVESGPKKELFCDGRIINNVVNGC